MAPSLPSELSLAAQAWLVVHARRALQLGVTRGERPSADGLDENEVLLRAPGASFVTLTKQGLLRGCIGSLEASRPLVDDVAENAWSAALRDPRFPPVQEQELSRIHLALSVLGKAEPLQVNSEEAALLRIEPHVHGVLLEQGGRRATFLPSVWKQIPDARDFLAQLKRKGGWSPSYWSADMRVSVYRVMHIDEAHDAGR